MNKPTQQQAKEFFGIKDDTWATMSDEERESYCDEIQDSSKFRAAFKFEFLAGIGLPLIKIDRDFSTEKEVKHTPTPWDIQDFGEEFFLKHNLRYRIVSPIFRIVELCGDGTETKANAAFIVRAVNNHEALLAAAKRLINDINNGEGIASTSIDGMEEAIRAAETTEGD